MVEIHGRKLRIVECVGEGGSSFVYKVQDQKDGSVMAVKKMYAQSREQLQDAQWEAEVHRALDSPHVLKLIEYSINTVPSSPTTKEIVMLLPYYEQSLQSLLVYLKKQDKCLPERDLLQMFLGICKGLQAFHKHEPVWAHRDIKPGNVLLTPTNTPILMDFGSTAPARITVSTRAQALAVQELAAERCTPQYRPPELFDVATGAELDERTDIWALGCTLFAMAFLQSPFEMALSEFGGSIGLAVMNGKYSFPQRHGYSQGVCDLIRMMLTVNPKERPFIDKVIQTTEQLLRQGPTDSMSDSLTEENDTPAKQ